MCVYMCAYACKGERICFKASERTGYIDFILHYSSLFNIFFKLKKKNKKLRKEVLVHI